MRKARKHAKQPYKGQHRQAPVITRLTAAAAGTAAGLAVAGTAFSAAPAQAQVAPAHLPFPAAVTAVRHMPETAIVAAGDTLSGIAARLCGTAADWPGIWHASRGITDPDVITIGQELVIACSSRDPGYVPPAPAQVTSRQVQGQALPAATVVSTAGDGSFRSCVIARESGGNSQVMNSTGHYGLYQFSASTWAAYGGDPADFGHASVTEQNQVFSTAMNSPGGAGNWSTYDGC